MILIAFDPGVTTGVCCFRQEDGDAEPVSYGQPKFDEILTWLDQMAIGSLDIVVIEDFMLLPHKARAFGGSRFETIQVIGMIKAYAHKHHAEVVVQSPTIKKIAEKWTGVNPPKNHNEGHWVDAFNHGMYYMIKEGLAKSLLEKNGGKP